MTRLTLIDIAETRPLTPPLTPEEKAELQRLFVRMARAEAALIVSEDTVSDAR